MLLGIILALLGGAMEGSFALPLKYTPKWKWENIWGAGSLFALVLVPWPLALVTIPHLGEVYRHGGSVALLIAFAFGCGWGAGGVCVGLGLSLLGLSLGLSLIMALNAVAGSIIPLLMRHPEQIARPAGLVLILGVAMMIAGIVLCGKAARVKEAGPGLLGAAQPAGKRSFRTGMLICIAAALLSALVNFGLVFSDGIRQVALATGADPASAVNAIWAPVFTGNYLVNVGYCAYLLFRHGSWKAYRAPGTGRYWAEALLMGLAWAGGIIVYGIGVTHLGALGAFLGFPVMLIGSIVTANVLGVVAGEWSGVERRAQRLMAAGVCVLLLAVVVLAYSNQLL